MTSAATLQNILHTEIPLTQEIGIEVKQCEANQVVLSAPLTPNINHKCTAFGGSLYSVAVLCGWGFVYQLMELHDLRGHIVIQHSEVEYKRPVDGEISAICTVDDSLQLNRFIKTYIRKARARINLEVKVVYNKQDAVIFNGQYVVHA